MVQSYVHSYETTGQPIALAFAAMFSRHAGMLALSDGVLVLSTSFCVLFARLLQKRRINYYGAGLAIQHTFQALVLATAVTWTFHRFVAQLHVLLLSFLPRSQTMAMGAVRLPHASLVCTFGSHNTPITLSYLF